MSRKIIDRYRNNQRPQQVVTPERAQSTPAQSVTPEQMAPTPSQVIQGNLMMNEQKRQFKKQQMMAIAQQMLQQNAMTPAKLLLAQRAQQAEQEYMMRKQLDAQRDAAELQAIMPQQTVQDSEQEMDIDENRISILENLYANNMGRPIPFMRPGLLQPSGSPYLYEAAMRPYQGGFINPNMDKQTRPLGNETTTVPSM